jgi:hypothetical protein
LIPAGFDGAGQLNGTAEQEQLLRERGFASIRMGDDGECSPTFNRVDQGSHGEISRLRSSRCHGEQALPGFTAEA